MRIQNPPASYDQKYMERLVASMNLMIERLNRRDVTFARVNISDLPTSATGLSAGDLWNDAGDVKVKT